MEFRPLKQVNADIIDVAAWFLLKESMTHKKIQKICYYAEAWSETLLNAPICKNNEFQAWVHGPVNLKLWDKFKEYGWNTIELIDADQTLEELNGKFSEVQLELLEDVWFTYGELSANDLEIQTHKETPWLEQREGLNPFASCSNVISVETMKESYRSVANEGI